MQQQAFVAPEQAADTGRCRPVDAEQVTGNITGRRDAAIQRGVEIILARQENFDKTEGHTEWPYEGVYRVRGENGYGQTPMVTGNSWSARHASRSVVNNGPWFVSLGTRL